MYFFILTPILLPFLHSSFPSFTLSIYSFLLPPFLSLFLFPFLAILCSLHIFSFFFLPTSFLFLPYYPLLFLHIFLSLFCLAILCSLHIFSLFFHTTSFLSFSILPSFTLPPYLFPFLPAYFLSFSPLLSFPFSPCLSFFPFFFISFFHSPLLSFIFSPYIFFNFSSFPKIFYLILSL